VGDWLFRHQAAKKVGLGQYFHLGKCTIGLNGDAVENGTPEEAEGTIDVMETHAKKEPGQKAADLPSPTQPPRQGLEGLADQHPTKPR
jgi:hypothetical protein